MAILPYLNYYNNAKNPGRSCVFCQSVDWLGKIICATYVLDWLCEMPYKGKEKAVSGPSSTWSPRQEWYEIHKHYWCHSQTHKHQGKNIKQDSSLGVVSHFILNLQHGLSCRYASMSMFIWCQIQTISNGDPSFSSVIEDPLEYIFSQRDFCS